MYYITKVTRCKFSYIFGSRLIKIMVYWNVNLQLRLSIEKASVLRRSHTNYKFENLPFKHILNRDGAKVGALKVLQLVK